MTSRAARVADYEVRGGEFTPPKELLLDRLLREVRGDDIFQGVRVTMHQGWRRLLASSPVAIILTGWE